MANFQKEMWDIKKSIDKVLLVEAFLEASILFLIAYLLISIAGFLNQFTTYVAIGIGVGFFTIKAAKNAFTDKVQLIGDKYPQLYEELLTARENASGKNQVVNDLHEEAVRHMSVIEESSFFHQKPVTIKTAAIIILCLLILLTAPFNLQQVPLVKDTINKISNTKISLSYAPQQAVGSGPKDTGVVEAVGNLFGQKRTVEQGITAAKFNVAASSFEVNLKDEEETGEDFKFDSVFPSEIGTPDPDLFAESIPKEQQELVKSYFRISAEG